MENLIERLRMVPSARLAARLFELSHAQLLETAAEGCEASPEVTNQAEGILTANNPLAQRLVEGVLLSRDLSPHVLAPLQLEDGAAAAVCSLWAEGWKATSEGRHRLTRVAFDLPADVLEDLDGIEVIPGEDEQLVVRSAFGPMRILDRSMSTVTRQLSLFTVTLLQSRMRIGPFYGGSSASSVHKQPSAFTYGEHSVLGPGGLLFCIDGFLYGEVDEIVVFDPPFERFRESNRFGKSLLHGARGLAVIGEELFVCDMLNDRLQVFSLAGEHRRSITGEWKRPSGLCVIKDRLYLVERMDMEDGPATYGPSLMRTKTPGRRIFILSLQGETLQVSPIPARQWNSFSRGDLCCFDGKLLVPMYTYDPGDGIVEIVALGEAVLGNQIWYVSAVKGYRETLGSRHPCTLTAINNLGLLLKDKGDFVAAELLHREALEGRRETLGSRHPDTLGSMNNLGLLLQAKGDLEDLVAAAPLLREALEGMRETLGRRHPGTLTYYTNNLMKNSTLLVKEYEAAIQDCTSNDQLDQLQDDFEAIHLIAELDLNAEMI